MYTIAIPTESEAFELRLPVGHILRRGGYDLLYGMVNESSLNSGSQAALEESSPVQSGPKRITEHGGLENFDSVPLAKRALQLQSALFAQS
jgi:hypothetical protein